MSKRNHNFIDLTGQVFGCLTALHPGERSKKITNTIWVCLCSCGKLAQVSSGKLKNGHTKSCGCFRRTRLIERNRTHGGCGTKAYRSWKHLLERCCNPNNKRWKDYGGRGINVCDRWREFKHFLVDMGEPPTKEHSIDRINNDGNYEPSNCRWATTEEQSRNTRRNRIVKYDGIARCVAEWAKLVGLPANALNSRIARGWDIHSAMTKPIQMKGRS